MLFCSYTTYLHKCNARAAQQQRLMFIIENTEYIQQQYNEPM